MTIKENKNLENNNFESKIGFILASVGSAVGMGNIWMFPYRLGAYGGAAFLIPYFLFVILFGTVGLSGEFAFGRLTGTGPIGSYKYAMESRGKKGGAFLGAIPLLGSLGIAIGYAIIVGWVLRFAFGSITGATLTLDSAEYFSQVTGKFGSIPWHFIVVFITVSILIFGVLNGIEKINKIMMPAFFILFSIIAIRVLFLPDSFKGYEYLLKPDWKYLLKPETWVMAMGQAFFSLSITGSGMIIYGSYLSKKEDITHSAVITSLLDTVAALISGFAIIPAVFAFGMDPSYGPPLMFITLPKIFVQMPFGKIFAVLFFLSVFFAGITSLVNLFEVCVESVIKSFKLKRIHSVILIGIIVFVVGLFIEYEPFLSLWMDVITIYIVPFGAMLGAVMIFWVLGKNKINEELNIGRKKPIGKVYGFFSRYIYIILAVSVFILGILYGGIG